MPKFLRITTELVSVTRESFEITQSRKSFFFSFFFKEKWHILHIGGNEEGGGGVRLMSIQQYYDKPTCLLVQSTCDRNEGSQDDGKER